MKVAILDDYQDVARSYADWDSLKPACEITAFHEHFEGDALVAKLADFECVCLMRERTPITRELLEKLPKLKLLITTGLRNASVDVQACTDHGVQFCGTEGHGPPTVEMTWALMLALARHIPQEARALRLGKWMTTVGVDISGTTLGVLGLGRLGGGVAKIGLAFGMKVIAWSQNLTAERCAQIGATLVDKDTLFRQSDFLTIHMVLSERSKGLVGAQDIAKMKPSAFLINTSRGPIVDEDALLAALRANKIRGAGIDVYSHEPLPVDHPFRSMDNLVASPHLGYVTEIGYKIFFEHTVEDIREFLKGNVVRGVNKLS